MNENEHEDDGHGELPSKSQLKRDSHALQEVGRTLMELPDAQLQRVPLPPPLLEAVMVGRRIRQRGGRKRQIKYVGKLLRNLDAEPILQALDELESRAAATTATHHAAERWRERLLEEGDGAVGVFVDAHPEVDRQQLRQLVRNAQAERKAEKPPRRARELFRLVRDTLERAGGQEAES